KVRNYDLQIVALVILMICLIKFNPGINYHNGMLAFVFAPFLLFLSANNGIVTTIFRKRIFVFLGEISYGIYILQPPVFNWVDVTLTHLNIKFSESYVQFFISLSVLVIFSALCYKFFETPIRRWIVRL
ncbi:MAG: acyltransferase, partial [Bacteroidetes bacterium]|nr:acyltransferase [Bacteroidota bacterium]